MPSLPGESIRSRFKSNWSIVISVAYLISLLCVYSRSISPRLRATSLWIVLGTSRRFLALMDINKHVISRAISALIGRWHQRMDCIGWSTEISVCEHHDWITTVGAMAAMPDPSHRPWPARCFCLFALLSYFLSYLLLPYCPFDYLPYGPFLTPLVLFYRS